MTQLEQLVQIAGEGCVKEQESMASHTTFRIGGPAEYFIEVTSVDVLRNVIRWCREQNEPWFVLGNGSNLLVADTGIRGVVLSMRGMHQIEVAEPETLPDGSVHCRVTAQSGALLSALASAAAKTGLTGLEFAGGIPGTLGGAVVMNAGAYGGEIKDVLTSATVLYQDGSIETLSCEQLELSYRHSIVPEKEAIVLEAVFTLHPGEKETILETMRTLNGQRKEKQPLEYGSAGSTFKRPEGYFAGKLIQDAGLRGYRCGDVMVSEKHCGFVVNVGKGTCEQALQVIHHVQEEVRRQFGVELELEVKQIP